MIVHPIMRWFQSAHLPDHLAKVSQSCQDLAEKMDVQLGAGEEKSEGLRKLLEAKDCFVRQAIRDKESA